MKKLVTNGAFLKKLSSHKRYASIIDQASIAELSTLKEICRNVDKIPFDGKERRKVMHSIEQVRALGRASRVRIARSLTHYLARLGVIQILISASFALFNLS